jgi:hypothetical protein
MPRSKPLVTKNTATDIRMYWEENLFANLSGLMKLGNFSKLEALQYIEQYEPTNPSRVDAIDSLQDAKRRGGSHWRNRASGPELEL